MPYSIRTNDDRCPVNEPFAVVQTDSDRLAGCHATRTSADDQITALNIAEDKTKEDAPNYRSVSADAAQKCTNCRFNTREMFCELFDFDFDPDHVCDAWEARTEAGKVGKMTREYKQRPIFIQKVDEDLGLVDAFVAVMGNIDLQQDIIEPGSFTKTLAERGHKIKVLDNHNTGTVRDVIGQPLMLREVGRGELPQKVLDAHPDATGALHASIKFLLDTPEGLGAFTRIKAGAVDQYSIGYDALDVEFENVQQGDKEIPVRRLKTIRLWEVSPVIFAANDATITLGAKNDEKGVNGAANLPLASRTRQWDSSAAESRVRTWADATDEPNAKYRRAFFWFDGDASENFTSYKLGFADVIDGELQAVPRGLFAVAGVLEGARGGVDIPEADQGRIKGRVSRYYAKMRTEFDDDNIVPPWDKSEMTESEIKAVNLTETVERVITAFYSQYPDVFEPAERRNVFWVKQVWDEFLIVKQDGVVANALWKVPYAIADGQVIFSQPSMWTEVTVVFVSVGQVAQMNVETEAEIKIGRSISARNGTRIVNAIVALAQVLEGAGFDIPGFGAPTEEAAQHEDDDEDKSGAIVPDENIAPTPDEQAAKDQQKADDEAGPDVQPPTSEGKELAIDFVLELEELSLLKLGG